MKKIIQYICNKAIKKHLTQKVSFPLYLFGKKIVGSVTYKNQDNKIFREIKVSNSVISDGLNTGRYYFDKSSFDSVSVWRTS